MKVYIVSYTEHNDDHIETRGVFSSFEKAEKYILSVDPNYKKKKYDMFGVSNVEDSYFYELNTKTNIEYMDVDVWEIDKSISEQ